jgi:hypothetical protein
MARPLNVIANEIIADFKREYLEAQQKSLTTGKTPKHWKQKYVYALAYVEPMLSLNSIHGKYYEDSAESVVAYALGNLTTWRGDKAKEIKAELNAMLKGK